MNRDRSISPLAEAAAALRKLQEADALLTEGVERIMGAASQLPGASHPLVEALRLSEEQAMKTLEAVEAAQGELAALRADGVAPDGRLGRFETHLQTILTTQQGQDLAGQRLKKSIALLQAVEERVRDALALLGHQIEADAVSEDTFTGTRLDQGNVDELLAQLGL